MTEIRRSENLVHRGVDIPSRGHCTQFVIRAHVSSDIPVHNQLIPKEHLASQEHLLSINKWTKAKKMKLNVKKTKNMVFNRSPNQFVTKLKLIMRK